MNRIDRLLGMVTALQSRRYSSAEALAERFEISVRTVYRDLRALDEIGIPVLFETGKGYTLAQGYFLPPVVFSNDEANALVLMETLVARFADTSIGQHYHSALNKIKAVMKASGREKLETLHEKVIAVTSVPQAENYRLADIQQAIVQQNILHIRYEDASGDHTARDIEPIGLVFYSLNWHIIAWCWLRNDYRDFRASRVVDLRNTGMPFRKNDHISLREYELTYSSGEYF